MNYYEKQQQEIATIKPRSIALNLSDADVRRLYEKTGKCGLTPAELLQNFISDLVDSAYSNGSDERAIAHKWFNHYNFSHCQNESLLSYLLSIGELEDFISTLTLIDKVKDDDRLTKDLAESQDKIQSYFEKFKGASKRYTGEAPTEYFLEIEIEKIIDWIANKDILHYKLSEGLLNMATARKCDFCHYYCDEAYQAELGMKDLQLCENCEREEIMKKKKWYRN